MRRLLSLLIDLLVIAFSTIFALFLRDNLELQETKLIDLQPYLFLTLLISVIVLPMLGTMRAVWRLTSAADYLRIAVATAAIVIGAVMATFSYNRLEGVARSLPIIQSMLMLMGLVGVRGVMRAWRKLQERSISRASGANRDAEYETILIAGIGKTADLFIRAVMELGADRVRIGGLLAADERYVGRIVGGHAVVGTVENIVETLRMLENHGVFADRIVIAAPAQTLSEAARDALVDVERSTTVDVVYLKEMLGLGRRPDQARPVATESDAAGGRSAFAANEDDIAASAARRYWRAKRALDASVALGMLIVMTPAMLVVAALIAIDVGLPVIFWQQRPGLNGRPFKLYKFRTMAAAHDNNGERIPDDERMSALGGFLRRTRLDELPQLFNVFAGEMSFIGPRPLLPVDQPKSYAARLLVRPGLTGWAQVKGGRAVSASDKAALDVWYILNASFLLDAEIVRGTFSMVLRGENVDSDAIRQAWRELREF